MFTNYEVNSSAATDTGSVILNVPTGTLLFVLNQLNSGGTTGSAASNNTITINPGLGTITLGSDLPVIQAGATINGPAAGQVIDGNSQQYRIFDTNQASLTLNNLTLQNGLAKGGTGGNAGSASEGAAGGGGLGAGGGVYIDIGQTLTLSGTAITGNMAQGGTGGTGRPGSQGGGGGGASWSRVTTNGINAFGRDGGGDFPGVGNTGGGASQGSTSGYGGGNGGNVDVSTGGIGSNQSGAGQNGTSGAGGTGGDGGYYGAGGGAGKLGVNPSSAGGGGGNGGGNAAGTTGGGGGGYGSGGAGGGPNEIVDGGGGGGGFGGGGGGSTKGGSAGGGGWGAGGGGAGNSDSRDARGKAGRYGGDGGYRGASNQNQGSGGGGGGVGGGVFISDGATLVISDPMGASLTTNIASNSAVGGDGGPRGGGGLAPQDGTAAGQDIFLFSGASILFNGGSNLTVNSAIEGDTAAPNGFIDSGINVSTTNNAIITLGSSSNNYRGATTITNGGTLSTTGANLPGNNVTTAGDLIIQSGGTFNQTAGTFPTNTILNNQSGGIVNIVGTCSPVSGSTNAGTINIANGGTFNVPTSFTSSAGTITTAVGGTLNINNTLGGILSNAGITNVTTSYVGVNSSSNTGTINISDNGNFTAPATYTNTGTTNLNGTGTITGAYTGSGSSILNIGNSSAASYSTSGIISGIATINIVSGSMTMNNAISGVTTFTNSSVLNVKGTQTLTASNFVSPGTQNYVINSNSSFDNLTVTGDANLNDGTVNVTSPVFCPTGSSVEWTILTANNITTNGNTTINPPTNSCMGMWEFVLGSNNIKIKYVRENAFEPLPGVDTEVNDVLQDMADNVTNSGQQALLDVVNSVTTQAEYDYLLNNLQPDVTAQSTTRSMQNIGFNKIENRISSINNTITSSISPLNASGIAAGDINVNTAVWLAGFGNISKQSIRGDNQGYLAKILGSMLGFDFKTNRDDIYGLAFGISNANVYPTSNDTFNTRVLGFNGMIYGLNHVKHNYFVEWVGSGVINKNYGVREFGVTGSNLTTTASYRGALGGFRINLGKDTILTSKQRLTLIASMQYVLVHQPSYDESSSVAALHIETRNNQSIFTLSSGLRLAENYTDAWGRGLCEVRGLVSYDVLSPNQITTANFVVGSNPFILSGTPARWALRVGSTYGRVIQRKLDLLFNLDFEVRTGYYNCFGEIKLRYLL